MNKRNLLFRTNIVIIITILFTGILLPQTNSIKDKFSFGIVSELLRNWKYQTNFHLGNYDSLKLDVIQSYSYRGDHEPNGDHNLGGFKDDISLYQGNVLNSIDFQNSKKVVERAKIVRPAYGQRSTYQAEYTTNTFPKYYYSELCFISQEGLLCFRN